MIDLVHKLPELDKKLAELLKCLDKDDWSKPTVAKLWTVKDVVAHLLDGNIRVLSGLRDMHNTDAPAITSYHDLLEYLNRLNAEWVIAMKRVSPEMLIDLIEHTSEPFFKYYASLDPHGKAEYSVAWAGENESTNWMHIAREYTEKFLHQQQIRDAVGKQGIITKSFYLPFLDVCMYALPHTLRNATAKKGSIVKLKITGEVSGEWFVVYNGNNWERIDCASNITPLTEIAIDAYDSWKLFSKSLRPKDLKNKINISGNQELGKVAVEMVSFMA
jgi:uncharacterized protein (TIGR03083 family)